MSELKIGFDRKNSLFSLSRTDLVDTHENLKSGCIIDNIGSQRKFAVIIGFHNKDNKTFAFCQEIYAKTMRPNGKCGWFSVEVGKITFNRR